ncbi:transporter substrate-binding protein [Litorivicinus sp.]|nr:transporter substrate-binding protein [Litorivicinus sp.]
MMNLDDIRYFYFVADKKSFSRAATALRTNISSVSRRVKNLEEALGATLLIRHSRGVELTSEGAAVFASAKKIYDESQILGSTIGELTRQSDKVIRIVVDDEFLLTWLLPKLPDFYRSFPEYLIEIVDQQMLDAEHSRLPDAYISLRKSQNLNLIEKQIVRSGFHFLISDRLLADLEIDTEHQPLAVRKSPIIVFPKESLLPQRQAFSELSLSIDVSRQCVLEVTKISEMYVAVKEGLGIGILPSWIRDDGLSDLGGLSAKFAREIDVFLSYPEHLRGAPRLEAIKTFFATYFTADPDCAKKVVHKPKPLPIKICSLFSETGFMSPWESPLNAVAKMAVDGINERGGLLGRNVEIHQPDPASKWDNYFECTKASIANDCKYFFGCWTSAARKKVMPALAPSKGILFYPLHFEGNEFSDDVVYLNAPPTKSVIPALDYARKRHPENARVITIGSDYVWPRTINETISSYLKASGMDGSRITSRYYPLGFVEFEDELRAITQAYNREPILLCISLVGPSLRSFLSQFAVLDLELDQIQMIAFDATDLDTFEMDCSSLEGLITCWGYFQQAANNDVNDDLVDSWSKHPVLASLPITDPAISTLNAISLWSKAVEIAQSDNLAAVRSALREARAMCPSNGHPIGLGSSGNIIDRKSVVATLASDGRFYPVTEILMA